MLCRQHVYDAIDSRVARVRPGAHVGRRPRSRPRSALAVLDLARRRALVERVRERGPRLRDELAAALDGCEIVSEVRGRGFLLGVELVDPRDGKSFLPVELDAASLVDDDRART